MESKKRFKSFFNKKTNYLLVLGFICLSFLVTYVSLAVFTSNNEQSGTFNIATGSLTSNISSPLFVSSRGPSMNKQVMVAKGEKKSFVITLSNSNKRSVKVNLYYKWLSNEVSNVLVGYTSNSLDMPPNADGYVLEADGKKMITVVIDNQSNANIVLLFGSNAGLEKAPLVLENNAHILELIETSSKVNAPPLIEGVIPVLYSDKEKEWVKADITKEWYNYDKQMWANVVTTSSKTRNVYKNAPSGTVIPMSDINTMWVWIPRYEYSTLNLGNKYSGGTKDVVGPININFIKTETVTASPSYVIHPSFKLGDKELDGIYVGKFETSSLEDCIPNDNANETGCDLTSLKPIIKPNVSSLRGSRISTQFTIANLMSDVNNIYGLNNADTHMMKNTEWGAVSYLTQSIYGKASELFNNNSNYITGCSSGSVNGAFVNACQNEYNTAQGVGASTTGNIYGIYDISGSGKEYVMGNMKNEANTASLTGFDKSNNSGFSGELSDKTSFTGRLYPDNKYYDSYVFGTSNEFNRYIKGDATLETNGWYNGTSSFVDLNDPWFIRDNIFSFDKENGKALANTSFRVTLSKK